MLGTLGRGECTAIPRPHPTLPYLVPSRQSEYTYETQWDYIQLTRTVYMLEMLSFPNFWSKQASNERFFARICYE